jgi:hypothetical protein
MEEEKRERRREISLLNRKQKGASLSSVSQLWKVEITCLRGKGVGSKLMVKNGRAFLIEILSNTRALSRERGDPDLGTLLYSIP